MIYKVDIPRSTSAFLYSINFLIEPSLTPKEIEVLSLVMEYNREYKALPKERRMAYIMSSVVKGEIKKTLDLKASNLSNILRSLKGKMYNGQQVLSSTDINDHLDIDLPGTVVFNMVDINDGQSEDHKESGGTVRPQQEPGRDTIQLIGEMGGPGATSGGQDIEHPEPGEDDILRQEMGTEQRVYKEEI